MSTPIPSFRALESARDLAQFVDETRSLADQEGIRISYHRGDRNEDNETDRDRFIRHILSLVKPPRAGNHFLWSLMDDRGYETTLDYWTGPVPETVQDPPPCILHCFGDLPF